MNTEKPEKYTVAQFNDQFPDEASCLRYIFNERYPEGLKCPKCGRNSWSAVKGRRAFACACGNQIYPTAGSIFHKSTTKLRSWFFAVFLFSTSKNGVAAKEIQRQTGVTYKCAWRLNHQIRKLMGAEIPTAKTTVEIDDTWIGGKTTSSRKFADKAVVLGMLERKGNVKAQVVKCLEKKEIMPIIKAHVEKYSTIMTDQAKYLQKLGQSGYVQYTINHAKQDYVRWQNWEMISTNGIENFWGQLKRSIDGTYHAVSRKHLQKYVDEFSFRYNRRKAVKPMFSLVLKQLSRPSSEE